MYFLLVQSINFTNTVSQFTGYVVDSADEKCIFYIFYLFLYKKNSVYSTVLKTIISVD